MDVLQPLRFEPIFKPAIWGGTRLKPFFGLPVTEEAIGEAWILSDQGDNQSVVLDGPLAGRTLRSLMEETPARILGKASLSAGRFPLLLKFIDAADKLSVQVHPTDDLAKTLPAPAGVANPGLGKTEAWVVLDAKPDSTVYAGVKEGTTPESLKANLAEGLVSRWLHEFAPKPGDCLFLEAGTVHALGKHLFIFEVQQTSDITYRMYDWGRVDAKSGKPRDLHIEQALKCVHYDLGPLAPQRPKIELEEGGRCERLVGCKYFDLWRWTGEEPFAVGAPGHCRAVVCVGGAGSLVSHGRTLPLRPGIVYLLPAETGVAWVEPSSPITFLECGLPIA